MKDSNPWNDVRDGLPETAGHSVEYLVQLENGDYLVAAWMNIGGWDFEQDSLIRYWMDIPTNYGCNNCARPIDEATADENGGYCNGCA